MKITTHDFREVELATEMEDDFEMEVHKEVPNLKNLVYDTTSNASYKELKAFARHFVEWGRKNRNIDYPYELEEAAKVWSEDEDNVLGCDYIGEATAERAFKEGAEWQKRMNQKEMDNIKSLLKDFDKHCDEYHDAGFKHGQEALLKDAVETTFDVSFPCGLYDKLTEKGVKDGDKLIIIKKE